MVTVWLAEAPPGLHVSVYVVVLVIGTRILPAGSDPLIVPPPAVHGVVAPAAVGVHAVAFCVVHETTVSSDKGTLAASVTVADGGTGGTGAGTATSPGNGEDGVAPAPEEPDEGN